MENYSFELAFGDERKRTLHHRPIAEIQVRSYGRNTEGGLPIITHECTTFTELDQEIDRLKKELETIRTKAHAKFAAEAKRG